MPALAHVSSAHASPVLPARSPEERARKLVVLEGLRARYGRTPSLSPGQLATGVPALASWIGGWPSGAVTEVAGLPGSGRLALLLPALRLLAGQGRPLVFVDAGQLLHPPSFPELQRSLLLVRPPSAQTGWAAEQVARSGAVPLVVVLDPPVSARAGVRLAKAAESGRSAVVVLVEAPDPELPAALRLEVDGWQDAQAVQVRCTRSRSGGAVGTRRIPLQGRVLEGRWPGGGAG